MKVLIYFFYILSRISHKYSYVSNSRGSFTNSPLKYPLLPLLLVITPPIIKDISLMCGSNCSVTTPLTGCPGVKLVDECDAPGAGQHLLK